MTGLGTKICNYSGAIIFYTQYDVLLICIKFLFILIIHRRMISPFLCYCPCSFEFYSSCGNTIKGRISKESPNVSLGSIFWSESHMSGLWFTYCKLMCTHCSRVVVKTQSSSLGSAAFNHLLNFYKSSGESILCALCDIGFISFCTIYDCNITTWLEVKIPI